MASEEGAGPSRPKRSRVEASTSYCGLTPKEVENIMKLLGDSDGYVDNDNDEEEPYVESGSEYLPSDNESDVSSVQENSVDEEEDQAEKATDTEKEDSIEEDRNRKEYSELNITWTKNVFIPQKFDFDGSNSGVRDNSLQENSLEIDYFFNLFTEDIAECIILESNRFALQRQEKKWKDLDLPEFYIFISITMLMSRNKKLSINEYWSKNVLLWSPIFGKLMSRDRYLEILRNIHFSNNETPENQKLFKVGSILKKFKDNFKAAFYPFQNLVIDESMVLFKGRLMFKQYIKTKRHRFGIKLYVLCDCETGFVLDFIVYVGTETLDRAQEIEGLGASGSLVATLMEPYLNKGHTLYTDNFYSSPRLSTFLFDNQTNSCGTVRANRKCMPNFQEKLKKGEVAWRTGGNLLVLKWKDRREVTLITSFHENEIISLDKLDRITNEPIKKPLCVVDYNQQMGAVDRSDMMISSVDCMRKSIKWYKKLFFHTIDLCLLNSHAMFTTKHTTKVPLAKFQLNLIQQIISRYASFTFLRT